MSVLDPLRTADCVSAGLGSQDSSWRNKDVLTQPWCIVYAYDGAHAGERQYAPRPRDHDTLALLTVRADARINVFADVQAFTAPMI